MFLQQEEKQKRKNYTLEEKRKQYPNAYRLWSIGDDEQLITLYNENKSIDELKTIFQRNEGAIRSRIRKFIDKR